MDFLRLARVILAAVATLLAATQLTYAYQNNLTASTNIFMFPKPYRIGNLVLKTLDGRTVSLNNYRGKVILLHFWSINCPACRMEEPLLHQLKRSFPPSDLEILAVNLVDPPQAIIGHATNNRSPYPVLFDGGHGYELRVVNMAGKKTAFVVNSSKEAILEVPAFPTTYILNGQGNVVGYSLGAARWTDRSAMALIQSLVAQRGAAQLRSGPVPGGERYSMRQR